MSDPPGKVLSSIGPCTEKRNSKLGGCAGVFFQLFDWNRRLNGKRLLPHKLLPAERPAKYASRNHKDEKLPMAKLLLIADENRGGFPRALLNEAGEVLIKEKTPEKKKNKRSPNVVAKLMGLETMPSPEPCKDRKQGKDNSFHKIDENIPSCDPNLCNRDVSSFRAESSEHSSVVPHSYSVLNSSHVSSTTQYASTLSDSMNARPPRVLVCHKSDDPKVSFFCKIPALSPRKAESTFRSILSPSKSHNKLLSPIKSPLSTKRAARLLEAAAKILEPSMQPSIRARGLGINSQAARSLLHSDASHEEKKSGSMTSRPSPTCPKKKPSLVSDSKKQVALRIYPDQPKAQGKSKQDKKPLNMQDSNALGKSQAPTSSRKGSYGLSNQESLRRSGSTKEESVSHVSISAGQQRLIRSKSVKEDAEQGKPSNGHHSDMKIVKEEKAKPESRMRSKLSQPAIGVKKRGSNLTPSDENFIEAENQNPNIVAVTVANNKDARKSSSADSVLTSSSNSGILNYSRLFNSRKAGTSHDPGKKTQKKGDSSVMKSFLRKKAVVTNSSGKAESKAVPRDSSQSSKIGKVDDFEKLSASESRISSSLSLSLDCVTEESQTEDGDPSSCSMSGSAFTPSLGLTSATETSDMSDETSMQGFPRDNKKLEPCSDSNEVSSSLSTSTFVHSGVGALEFSVQSSCDTLAGDFGDSGSSSYAYRELLSHRRKKPVSYSGKSTAAILQELLLALNSAKTQAALNESSQNMSADISECVSSSKFTLCTQLGEDCEDSASSAPAMNDDFRTTPTAMRRYIPGGECGNEWRHPSPVSTLEFLFEDTSSATSDNFEDAQERKLLSKVRPKNQHDIVSRRHHIDLPAMVVESKAYKQGFECEEQYVKDIVSTANLSPVDIYAAKLQFRRTLLDPVVFMNLEEQFYQQWKWGVLPEVNMYAKCRSDTDMRFTRSMYVEAGVQNRKLVFECVNEALNAHLGINEHYSRQSSSQSLHSLSMRHVSQSVCRQVEAWRRMACCMNVDDLVDQEMNSGFGKWVDFSDEVSDFALEMEGNIVKGLIDELIHELGRRLPNRQGSQRERIRASC